MNKAEHIPLRGDLKSVPYSLKLQTRIGQATGIWQLLKFCNKGEATNERLEQSDRVVFYFIRLLSGHGQRPQQSREQAAFRIVAFRLKIEK